MKTNFREKTIAILIAVFSFAVLSNAQVLEWHKEYNSTNYTNAFDKGYAVVVDPSNGDVYVTGGVDQYSFSSQDKQIITIKYNSSGTQQWATVTNGYSNTNANSEEHGNCIALDGQGHVWVAATMDNGATYGEDITLIKYKTSSGSISSGYPKKWNDLSGTNVPNGPGGHCLAVKDSSHVYIGGNTYVSSTNIWKGIILKDSTSGWAWNYTFNGSYTGAINQLATSDATDMKLDASGNLYATGWESDDNVIDKKCFTVKLSPGGSALSGWPQTYNYSTGEEYSYALLLVNSGSNGAGVYIAGSAYVSGQIQGLIVNYSLTGGAFNWANYSCNQFGKGEKFFDIAGIGTCPTTPSATPLIYVCGWVLHYNTTYNDYDYVLGAYNASTGAIAPTTNCWSTNPIIYDGSACPSQSCQEAGGTDWAAAVEYSSATSRVYITGNAYDVVSSVKNVNITTRGYVSTSGTLDWSLNFDYATDAIIGTDDVYKKYSLTTQTYSDCNSFTWDNIFVEGETWVNHSPASYDLTTLKYYKGVCTSQFGRMPSELEPKSHLYPNPSSAAVTLHLEDNISISNATLTIYDLEGNIVSKITNINSNDISIDRNSKTKGMYFFQLTDVSGIILSGKFIVAD